MLFATPVWLLFLLPWLGLVVWLLTGRRHRVAVPFLELWSGPIAGAKTRRTIQPPPAALACALAGILLAILGAGSPMLHSGGAGQGAWLIVDRGVTMSAMPRIAERNQSLPKIDSRKVILVPPWPGLLADGSNWKSAPPSASQTGELLHAAIADVLARDGEQILLLSDVQPIPLDPRIVQIPPSSMPQNVSIVRVAVSVPAARLSSRQTQVASPPPQLMVRIRNQSSIKSCQLTAISEDQSATKTITLPPANEEANFFIDLAALGDAVDVNLGVADDLSADDRAWLIRQSPWPKIETRSNLSPELKRMIDVYQIHRPANPESRRVIVVDNLFSLPADQPAVAVLRDGTNAKPSAGTVGVEFGNHPAIAGVDWRAVAADAVAAESPGDGWTTLVRAGPRVLVAARGQPARQVWVGFNSVEFPKSKDFVIFWTNVLSWAGQGDLQFTGESMQTLGDAWQLRTSPIAGGFDVSPGIYARADGSSRAMNALDVKFSSPVHTDWRGRLASQSAMRAGVGFQSFVWMGALLSILAAGGLWKSRGARQGH